MHLAGRREHTLVHVFLNHPRIKPTRDKEHGIVAHFSHSTGVDGLGALLTCQTECNHPKHYPVKDNDTRWSSGHNQMEWFRVGQRAIQLYDVNHQWAPFVIASANKS